MDRPRPTSASAWSAAALAVLVIAAAAAAQTARLHVGSTPYVRVVRLRDGGLTVELTASARRQVARRLHGRVLDATCTTLGSPANGPTQTSSAESGQRRPGAAVAYHTLLDRHADYCDIGLARQTVTHRGVSTTSEPGPPLDSIALTQTGAAYLYDDRVVQRMLAVLTFAEAGPAGRVRDPQDVASVLRGRVIALGSPDASPPAGVVGFFSDGLTHAAAVALSAQGGRLFIESAGGVFATNARAHLFRVLRREVATLPQLQP